MPIPTAPVTMAGHPEDPTGSRAFSIEPRGPFNWDSAFDFFYGFRPVGRPGDDSPGLRTAFVLDRTFESVAVSARWEEGRVRGEVAGTDDVGAAAAQLARILSLDVDGTEFPAVADRDPELGAVMEALPGLRPVLFLSPYECAAWGVLSLRISGRQAAAAQRWLAREHGTRLEIDGAEVSAFPTPRQLLGVRDVPGVAEYKVERLHAVARAALDGKLDAAELRALGEERALALLRTIPGIGEFWSLGIYTRACGVADAFPREPLAVAALGRLHGLGDRPSDADLVRLTDAYRPFRMWVTFLLRVAAGRGIIPGIAGREREIRELARRS